MRTYASYELTRAPAKIRVTAVQTRALKDFSAHPEPFDCAQDMPVEGRPDSFNGLELLNRSQQLVLGGTPEGEQKFQLITDACNCSGKVKVQHFVEIDLGDEVTQYTPELIKVTGKFSVSLKRVDGFVVSLYRLKAESLE